MNSALSFHCSLSCTAHHGKPKALTVSCSEAIWQRCWASASDAKLRVGAVWGAAQVSLIVFVFGFGGFLAVWGGLFVPSGPDDPGNTILFALLNSQGQQVCGTDPKQTGPASEFAFPVSSVEFICWSLLHLAATEVSSSLHPSAHT